MTNDKIERRRANRQNILDSFSVFIVVPKKGPHRLKVHNVSTVGIAFDLDIEGEPSDQFPLQTGESLDGQLYLNQSLFVPLQLKITRLSRNDGVRQVGADVTNDKEGKSYQAFKSFVNMIEAVAAAGQIVQ